jgi:toxin-antitoxin system PIN domain toxin
MILPDVNVLIDAFRKDAVRHNISNHWLNSVVDAPVPFGISRLVLAAVVRVTTDRRIHKDPSSLSEAMTFVNYLLDQPHCHTVEPGERHWDIFTRLCVETNTTGPRITDAWYAALAIEHGCEWITFDSDFARFPGLKFSAPTAV